MKTKDNFKKKKGKSPKVNKPNKDDFIDKKQYECNNPSWYTRNKQVANDAGSLSFSAPLGMYLGMDNRYLSNQAVYEINDTKLPGIMTIEYIPTIGVSNNGSSAVNVAGRQVYTWVRHANSGSRNYESPDLMMYLLAVSSAYSFHAELCRLYGLFNTYSYQNRYVNKALVIAAGGDYNDLSSNLADLRYLINQFGVKLNTFAIPKDMDIFERQYFLPFSVFADSKLDKSSLYMFKPTHYWKWDGTGSTGTSLVKSNRPSVLTIATIQSKINELISSLIDIEDVGIISGDILKAFGEGGLRQLGMLEASYASPAIYDEHILSQIHNMTYLGPVVNVDITQANGNLIYQPSTNLGSVVGNQVFSVVLDTQLLDSGEEDPSVEFVLEATRLQYSTKLVEGVTTIISTCGTEIVNKVYIHTLLDNGSVTTIYVPSFTYRPSTIYRSARISNETEYSIWNDVLTEASELESNILSAMSTFDWAPISIGQYSYGGGIIGPEGNQITVEGTMKSSIHGAIFNYTPITRQTLDKINEVCLQSLLNVYGTYLSNK